MVQFAPLRLLLVGSQLSKTGLDKLTGQRFMLMSLEAMQAGMLVF